MCIYERNKNRREYNKMNKPITVNKLKILCEEQIKKGNGNKVIMTSDDDEGNGYHYMWYDFTEAKELLTQDEIVDSIASLENTIILG